MFWYILDIYILCGYNYVKNKNIEDKIHIFFGKKIQLYHLNYLNCKHEIIFQIVGIIPKQVIEGVHGGIDTFQVVEEGKVILIKSNN